MACCGVAYLMLLCILKADADDEGESDPGSEELEADIPDVDGSHDVYLKSSSCYDERGFTFLSEAVEFNVCFRACCHLQTHHAHTQHSNTHSIATHTAT